MPKLKNKVEQILSVLKTRPTSFAADKCGRCPHLGGFFPKSRILLLAFSCQIPHLPLKPAVGRILAKSMIMKNKWFDFLESYHNAFRVLGHILTWGGFLLIVIVATIAQGFPNGFVTGLVVGSLFAFIGWLRFRNSYNNAVEAREKLAAYSQGHKEVFNTSKQATYAILSSMVIGVLALLLLGSCFVYSCKNELIRTQLFFLLIGLSIAIQQLFWKERVKGKSVFIALGLLGVLVIFLLGKIFSVW